ncbi:MULTISPECIES: hypothetical protein [Pseudonocardia]|uniref:hypothetical protein n=1 Tax=Pseudonocardia sp. SID8383 TaxID=2690363 RepID=UPI000B2E6787|nr:hypothetical protein [Pseudonocardia sp. SID8383]
MQPAREFSSSPAVAVGVEATADGTLIQVGGPHLLDQHGAAEFAVADQWCRQGAIVLHTLVDGEVIARCDGKTRSGQRPGRRARPCTPSARRRS